MKKLFTIIGIVTLLAMGTQAQTNSSGGTGTVQNLLPAGTIPSGVSVPAFDTNGLDFTNVSYEVASGLEYAANGGALTFLEANIDLHHFSAVDIGVGAEATLSGSGPGLHSAELDAELIKDFSNFQFIGKAGVGGYIDVDQGVYGDAVAEINYNLTSGTGAGFLGNKDLFTYVGGNVELQVAGISNGAAQLDKIFHIYVGIAF